MKAFIKTIINIFFKLFPVKKNKIVFQSGRNKVDCGPYNIYKELVDTNDNFYRRIWIVEKDTDVSMLENGDYAFYPSFKAFYHLATAKYLIRSQSLDSPIKKRSNQSYIQTWHGAGALKKCGYDSDEKTEGKNNPPVDHVKDWDFLLATDKYNEIVMKSSTGYCNNSIVIGNSDTDILINASKKYISNIYKKLGIKNDKKYILYAPTFRDNELNDTSNYHLPIEKLKDLPNDYIILLRLHPLMNKVVSNLELPNNFINVGWYPNILDLYLISDMMITDYSSVVFPFAVLNKPIILYPYDYDDYVKLRGGFYIDYGELPGPICYTQDELYNSILDKKLSSKYKNKYNEFNKKFNSLNNGKVSKEIIQKLKEGYFNK